MGLSHMYMFASVNLPKENKCLLLQVCTYRQGEEAGYILTSNEKVDRTIEYG